MFSKKYTDQKLLFLIVLLQFGIAAHLPAQSKDEVLISQLIKNIATEQVSADGEFYTGSFPSYRKCAGVPHNYQPDNNIFFTALSAFALRNMLPYLQDENKMLAQQVIENAKKAYPYYQNKQGYPYYNFWPSHARVLPNSYFVKYFDKQIGMGDDADDAVMVLMASDANDSICKLLKERLIKVSNLSKQKIVSTRKKYSNIPAYSTYLGLRMKPDFDLAVHCNILYFMYDRQLPPVKQDSATIHLLVQMVKNRDYVNTPMYVSPYYVKPALLLYHMARLMGQFKIAELENYKPQLIADLQSELSKTKVMMEKLILSTSLLRLGATVPAIDIENLAAFNQTNPGKFIFFQARAAYSFRSPFKQLFLHSPYLTYYFYSPAYNKILWLEYLVERNKHKQD